MPEEAPATETVLAVLKKYEAQLLPIVLKKSQYKLADSVRISSTCECCATTRTSFPTGEKPLTFYVTALRRGQQYGHMASFMLQQMPGCCGVLISFHASVSHNFKGMGIGKILNAMRIEMATALGYTTLLCTDVKDNPAQQRILDGHGWKVLHAFKNKRTGHNVEIRIKEV